MNYIACQISLSMGFSKQEYQSELPFPSPGGLPNPGIKPVFLMSHALIGGFCIPICMCIFSSMCLCSLINIFFFGLCDKTHPQKILSIVEYVKLLMYFLLIILGFYVQNFILSEFISIRSEVDTTFPFFTPKWENATI